MSKVIKEKLISQLQTFRMENIKELVEEMKYLYHFLIHKLLLLSLNLSRHYVAILKVNTESY